MVASKATNWVLAAATQPAQEVGRFVRRHDGGAHQLVEVASQHANVLDGVEGEVYLTDVHGRALLPWTLLWLGI